MRDGNRPARYGASWSREELILAFDLYCRIPFSKTKASNAAVSDLARLLSRSPGSIARKLGNLGSFDDQLRKRNITGLTHASKLDQDVWHEFHSDWNRLVLVAQRLRESWAASNLDVPSEGQAFMPPEGQSETQAMRAVRVHQKFFRDAVLSSYDETCCITGLRIAACLVASHIIPWRVSEKLRADPRNGLCLSATFDRLFDRGLLALSASLEVMVSASLRQTEDPRIQNLVCAYHGRPIVRPGRFLPMQESLEWHRRNVFCG